MAIVRYPGLLMATKQNGKPKYMCQKIKTGGIESPVPTWFIKSCIPRFSF